MGLKGIMAISGMSGLYKVIAQTKSGFIVESMIDKKRHPVSSNQKISMLDDISVFTTSEDLPLKEVLLKMKEQSVDEKTIDPKDDSSKLKDFLKKILPEYDEQRVYPSDIKKMITWYFLVKDIVDQKDESETDVSTDATTNAGDLHQAQTVAEHQHVHTSQKKTANVKLRKKV